MKINSYLPDHAALKESIEYFYILEHSINDPAESFLILPGTATYVSVSLNTATHINNNAIITMGIDDPAFDSAIQHGLKAPCIYRYEGAVKELCIRFKAGGAYSFFAEKDITDSMKQAAAFIPYNDYKAAMTALLKLNGHKEIINNLEKYLLKNIRPAAATYLTDVADVLKNTESDNKINLELLAQKYNITRQTLNIQFSKYFHLSPSEFRQICRFRKFIEARLNARNPVSLTNTVYDIGFFDQSHLIKHFHKYSFLKPKEFFRKINFSEDKSILLLWQ